MWNSQRSQTRLRSVVSDVRRRLQALRDPQAAARPRLAAGVRLVGPMTESAFADQPWLVERNGRFLQVTELLFHVAELADGKRSMHDIAEILSATRGVTVRPDQVRLLVETKLVPIGLVDPLNAPGRIQSAPTGVTMKPAAAPRSPLALNMRMALISPRIIDPLTRVFQYLYLPPVLLLMLFVTVQAQAWLLFVHGVNGGINEVLGAPSRLPLVFVLLVASAAFHELGHAAALRYGGGRVRGMGVGLYLMYPAFYTDVTENYRLGRWARVRTDLGGFYFNLLFSLALMGVYHRTGHEFLLLAAFLTDLDILHQCLPFVRLDGYWALADLTGIPDFFSMMGAYVRTVLPVGASRGRKLPRLKWWAKAVFGIYLLVALPAIAWFLFAMLQATPRILLAASEAVQRQLASVGQAQAVGDALGAAGAEAQMVLALLPALGLGYMLLNLGRAFSVGLWRWSRPTPARRFLGSVLAAAVASGLVMLWAPNLASMAVTTVTASVLPTPSPRAEAISAASATAEATRGPAATASVTATTRADFVQSGGNSPATPTTAPERVVTAPTAEPARTVAPATKPKPSTAPERPAPAATPTTAPERVAPAATATTEPESVATSPARAATPAPRTTPAAIATPARAAATAPAPAPSRQPATSPVPSPATR